MATLSIRNLPEQTYLALKERAAARQERRSSIEAEAREILIEATRSHQGLGATLVAIGRRVGSVDSAPGRDQQPLEPSRFE